MKKTRTSKSILNQLAKIKRLPMTTNLNMMRSIMIVKMRQMISKLKLWVPVSNTKSKGRKDLTIVLSSLLMVKPIRITMKDHLELREVRKWSE